MPVFGMRPCSPPPQGGLRSPAGAKASGSAAPPAAALLRVLRSPAGAKASGSAAPYAAALTMLVKQADHEQLEHHRRAELLAAESEAHRRTAIPHQRQQLQAAEREASTLRVSEAGMIGHEALQSSSDVDRVPETQLPDTAQVSQHW
jgi:hypothetical protein